MEIANTKHRKKLIAQYHKELKKQENQIPNLDENTSSSLVNYGIVYPDGHIVFTFNDGTNTAIT